MGRRFDRLVHLFIRNPVLNLKICGYWLCEGELTSSGIVSLTGALSLILSAFLRRRLKACPNRRNGREGLLNTQCIGFNVQVQLQQAEKLFNALKFQ